MRKVLLSVTAAVALAAPLALAGAASAGTVAPAHLAGTYYTNVGHQMHEWHVAHEAHEAHLASLGGGY